MHSVTSFREQLEFLRSQGQLQEFSKPVDIKFELSAISKKLESGPALLFKNVKGYDMPVAIGTDNSRARIAQALGTDNAGLIEKYSHAITHPIEPVYVEDGPVKEVKITKDIDLMKLMPIPFHHEKNAGHYITTGLFVAEDPVKKVRNISYHRLQVTGPAELRALVLPRHLKQMIEEVWARGEALPVAITIGNDIAVRLAAATWGSGVGYGFDEFAIAGALRGEPMQLVRCETNCVMVPAKSEIVIEGVIRPNAIKVEGGFAELTGLYAKENPNGYVIDVTAVTMRHDAIFQDLLVFTPEHHLLLGLPFEPVTYMNVKASVPSLVACHITPASCGKFHCILSIKKKLPGDAKDAILAALCSMRDIKHVVVVDDDVNIFDPRDVEWAIATRFQADRGLVVINGANGNQLDHSSIIPGITSKMGLDATYPKELASTNERIRIPGEESIRPEDYI